MGIHDVVFILDLAPETTGSSAVFPFPLYPSFIPSLPFLIPPSFYSLFSLRNVSAADWGNKLVDTRCIVYQRLLQTHRRGFILTHSLSSPVRLSFQPMRKEPEVVTVTLKKHNGMGLSIVAAKVGNTSWKCVCVSVSVCACVNTTSKILQIWDLFEKLFLRENFSFKSDLIYFLQFFF